MHQVTRIVCGPAQELGRTEYFPYAVGRTYPVQASIGPPAATWRACLRAVERRPGASAVAGFRPCYGFVSALSEYAGKEDGGRGAGAGAYISE
jgi:hypothetical protein